MSSTIEQTDSCKPAGLISGKRCGLAAVHNPPRLQAELLPNKNKIATV
jgi:hypothetical protein